jgi:hypothetical protein
MADVAEETVTAGLAVLTAMETAKETMTAGLTAGLAVLTAMVTTEATLVMMMVSFELTLC